MSIEVECSNCKCEFDTRMTRCPNCGNDGSSKSEPLFTSSPAAPETQAQADKRWRETYARHAYSAFKKDVFALIEKAEHDIEKWQREGEGFSDKIRDYKISLLKLTAHIGRMEP